MKVNNILKLFVGVTIFIVICSYSHKGYSDTVKKIVEFTVSLNGESVPETEKNTWYEEFGCFLNTAEASSSNHDIEGVTHVRMYVYRKFCNNCKPYTREYFILPKSTSEDYTYTGRIRIDVLDRDDKLIFTGEAINASGEIIFKGSFSAFISTSELDKVTKISMTLPHVSSRDNNHFPMVALMTNQEKFLPGETAVIKIGINDDDEEVEYEITHDSEKGILSNTNDVIILDNQIQRKITTTLTPPSTPDDVWGHSDIVTVKVDDRRGGTATASIAVNFAPETNLWLLNGEVSDSREKVDLVVKEFKFITLDSDDDLRARRLRDGDDADDSVILIQLEPLIERIDLSNVTDAQIRTIETMSSQEIDNLKVAAIGGMTENMKELTDMAISLIPGNAGAVCSTAKTVIIDCPDLSREENDTVRYAKGICALILLHPAVAPLVPINNIIKWQIDGTFEKFANNLVSNIFPESKNEDFWDAEYDHWRNNGGITNKYGAWTYDKFIELNLDNLTIRELNDDGTPISDIYYDAFDYGQWIEQQNTLQDAFYREEYQSEQFKIPSLTDGLTTIYFPTENYQSLLPKSTDILNYQKLLDTYTTTPSITDYTTPSITDPYTVPYSDPFDTYTPSILDTLDTYTPPIIDPYIPPPLIDPYTDPFDDYTTPYSDPFDTYTPTYTPPTIPTYTPPVDTPYSSPFDTY